MVVFVCMVGFVVVFGVGCFVFMLLLLLMFVDGLIGLKVGGWFVFVNYVGYFVGVVSCVVLYVVLVWMVCFGFVVIVLLIVVMGIGYWLLVWFVVCFVVGVVSVWMFVFML